MNDEEAAFIEAAVARLIPADDQWPGALEADVPNYIDKQLGGAWGAGERLYRSGPSQGYQLPFTPAELFRTALAAINAELKAKGGFAKMGIDEQHAYLHGLEAGGKLPRCPANTPPISNVRWQPSRKASAKTTSMSRCARSPGN